MGNKVLGLGSTSQAAWPGPPSQCSLGQDVFLGACGQELQEKSLSRRVRGLPGDAALKQAEGRAEEVWERLSRLWVPFPT